MDPITIGLISGALNAGIGALKQRELNRQADNKFRDDLSVLRNSPFTNRQANFAGTQTSSPIFNVAQGLFAGLQTGLEQKNLQNTQQSNQSLAMALQPQQQFSLPAVPNVSLTQPGNLQPISSTNYGLTIGDIFR